MNFYKGQIIYFLLKSDLSQDIKRGITFTRCLAGKAIYNETLFMS